MLLRLQKGYIFLFFFFFFQNFVPGELKQCTENFEQSSLSLMFSALCLFDILTKAKLPKKKTYFIILKNSRVCKI